ncbi:hypothetical protein ColLi_12502 [Colletotrichum liriopes]|uniref:Secreted protein n=1 Tax=Colletotrichum liriopes TaxID=708192 RepID=A0AA37LYT1_9PEZI|nr:hypothetical protein ColLi_12502 [Colletotrichum liriopes]
MPLHWGVQAWLIGQLLFRVGSATTETDSRCRGQQNGRAEVRVLSAGARAMRLRLCSVTD